MKKSLNLFVTFVLITFFWGCVSKPTKRQPLPASNAARVEFEKARKLLAKNKPQGLAQLKKFANKYPESDLVDDAYLQMGQLQFEAQDYKESYANFMAVFKSEIYSPEEARAAFMAARCLFHLGRYEEASSLSGEVSGSEGLTPEIRVDNLKLRFILFNRLNDKLDALSTLIELAEVDITDSARKSDKIKAMDFVEQLSNRELEEVASSSKYSFVRAQALYKVGTIFFEQRDFDRAKSFLSNGLDLVPDSVQAERAREMIKQINARSSVDYRTIGVVLPLSGPNAAVGNKTLHGLQLGLGVFGKDRSDFRLAVIDSEGNPESARRAVERLVTEDNVIAVVGSVLGRESTVIATKCEELGVPNITLSQKSGLTTLGTFVFRSALTGEMQISRLVQAAMEEKGFKKFAVLYPNDPYGVEYANVFWDEVLSRGGEVVAVQTYAAGETDFGDAIKRLVGTYAIEDRLTEYKLRLKEWIKKQKSFTARNKPPEDLLPPVVRFDALFIPDNVKAVGQIAPTLAYHDILNVPLLGTNLWNNQGLIERGQKYVENALFVDGQSLDDTGFRNSPFYSSYKNAFAEEPSLFEAQAYDVGILLRQIIASGERSRVGLSERLAQMSTFAGALGPMRMNSQRELVRPMSVMAVKNGTIVAEPEKPTRLR